VQRGFSPNQWFHFLSGTASEEVIGDQRKKLRPKVGKAFATSPLLVVGKSGDCVFGVGPPATALHGLQTVRYPTSRLFVYIRDLFPS
jgi:hypothetical protein